MYKIFENKNGMFIFRLFAVNGQAILESEEYSTTIACQNGIALVKKYSQNRDSFKKLKSSNGKFYFYLLASNGQVIGTSYCSETEIARDNLIQSVIKNSQNEGS